MSDLPQPERTSVLLIKPDGVSDPEKARLISEAVQASHLKVISHRDILLEPDDIDDIWPKFASVAHAFTRRMLTLYMTSGLCRALVVEGDDVIATCRAVRSKVRRQFGDAAFENALHTPTDREERASNVAFLVDDRKSFRRHRDLTAGRGRFGRFADLSESQIETLADGLWDRRLRYGWETYRNFEVAPGQCGVTLFPGSDNSIDFEISAIAEVFSDHDIEWSASRFLEAEKFGECTISCGPGDASLVFAKLTDWGVKASISVSSARTPVDDD